MIDIPRPRIHRSAKGNRSVLQNSATPRKLNHWYARKLGIFTTVTLISGHQVGLSYTVGLWAYCSSRKLSQQGLWRTSQNNGNLFWRFKKRFQTIEIEVRLLLVVNFNTYANFRENSRHICVHMYVTCKAFVCVGSMTFWTNLESNDCEREWSAND
ncbi:hypothetical protein L1887_39521 [Cichorium endivia]|nr:hypothetical protein L1887_39521 [Cichorium endivia]